MSLVCDPLPHATQKPTSRPAPRVAYIMSRFPKLTETFVLFEMLAVEAQGVNVEVFPLLRARNSTTHPEGAGLWRKVLELLRKPDRAAVMHPAAQPLVARAHYAPFLNGTILAAQFRHLWRQPLRYLHTLATLVRANWGSPNYLLGSLAIFPKAAWWAHRMPQLGVTHLHAHFANHPAAAAFVVHRLSGIPYSFTGHGADLQVDQHMLAEKVQHAARVVTISEDNRRFIGRYCRPSDHNRVEVIRCGVDTARFQPASRPPCAEPLQLVCTGTLYEVKGHRYLIDACRLLAARNLQFECHLIGDGPLRESLEQQVREADLSQQVLFHGRQTQQEILQRLQQSHVAVCPSIPTASGRREGIPVVLMEAMACGLPVVASRISGIPELVEDGRQGLLVAPADPAALADAVQRLSTDASLRQRLGSEARRKICHDYDLHRNAARLCTLFAGTGENS